MSIRSSCKTTVLHLPNHSCSRRPTASGSRVRLGTGGSVERIQINFVGVGQSIASSDATMDSEVNFDIPSVCVFFKCDLSFWIQLYCISIFCYRPSAICTAAATWHIMKSMLSTACSRHKTILTSADKCFPSTVVGPQGFFHSPPTFALTPSREAGQIS